ncbi:hypothetical protein HN51_025910 [Arachis hypogaea]|uniref:Uncharacterized protein n=2 Tax=Arachis TaxID=3817 RepID=A0A445CFN8_ARAHY|nr:uncharacterized protein LOC107459068 [Arachis duranensis]XP_025611436.1 uncharacterized protein LOC112704096 [Arachis hypogaea]QHO28420.1 uncharacterized protein DS421_7g216530 [Arachis hypogaea]RYR49749.1 hypothetical protein Ahy_A07g036263 [Arachis hypogaea]
MVGVTLLMRFSLLLLLLAGSLSLLWPSFAAGGRSKFIGNLVADVDHTIQQAMMHQDGPITKRLMDEEEVNTIHERVLRANTRDYGSYNPAPKLSKPRSKRIPN